MYIYNIYIKVVVGRLDQKMPGPIFCPSPALHVTIPKEQSPGEINSHPYEKCEIWLTFGPYDSCL